MSISQTVVTLPYIHSLVIFQFKLFIWSYKLHANSNDNEKRTRKQLLQEKYTSHQWYPWHKESIINANQVKNNIYVIDNLTHGDDIQTTIGLLTRIQGQNVNGIESSLFSTLELVCDSMNKFNIDIAGLSETKLHFVNP